MATPGNHDKLIDQAAKAALKPIGCVQKGRSRFWFDDRRWWVGVIEFQPSSWSRGSYLNVGAMWLWHAKDHWSFDDGYRLDGFRAYRNDDEFTQAALAMSERAAQEVARMRQAFASIGSVARHLGAKKRTTVWDDYHAAIAAALAGDADAARSGFAAVAAAPVSAPWVVELQQKAASLAEIGGCVESMRRVVASEVVDARGRLKLPACETAVFD